MISGVISNSEVLNNLQADSIGAGGIYTEGTSLIVNCTIAGNVVVCTNNLPRGGGIYAYRNGNTIIDNCVIYGNAITNGWGGGVYLESKTLRNSLIYANNARYGGGVLQSGKTNCNPEIQNCTIVSNYGYMGAGGLRTVCDYLSTISVENVIAYYNTSDNIYSNLYFF